MIDIYVVLDGTRVVGASTMLQGAEEVRSDDARRRAKAMADSQKPPLSGDDYKRALDGHYAWMYDRMTVTNTELRDAE